jgi:hypothetical protein
MKASHWMSCGCGEQPTLGVGVAETSNPGPVGVDTGYTFTSCRTGEPIRVIARFGESREDAIARVRRNHACER